MNILLDTNVALDLFLERKPFVDDAQAIWKLCGEGKVTGFISAITPPNVYYIARKMQGHDKALNAVSELLALF